MQWPTSSCFSNNLLSTKHFLQLSFIFVQMIVYITGMNFVLLYAHIKIAIFWIAENNAALRSWIVPSRYASEAKQWDLVSTAIKIEKESQNFQCTTVSGVNLDMIAAQKQFCRTKVQIPWTRLCRQMCNRNWNAKSWGHGSLICSRTPSPNEQRIEAYTHDSKHEWEN